MDTRRTILWIVFSLSLILLWDAWLKYTGKPPMFFGGPAATQTAAPAPTVAAPGTGDVPTGSAQAPVPAATPAEIGRAHV